ncbi:hypothetical protein Hamer_G014612 [Homarus americanus]|uniref:Uncharacterized protein n=1 Tax=Homarus americanus TaxID=6706 RepID=A0A8J5N4K1_HOMAM|nr:hypothetical protein Hamer_G014612 [Homarus americanus]
MTISTNYNSGIVSRQPSYTNDNSRIKLVDPDSTNEILELRKSKATKKSTNENSGYERKVSEKSSEKDRFLV